MVSSLNRLFRIGQGDTGKALQVTILDEDKVTPVNLSGFTATFSMMSPSGEVVIDEKPATIGGTQAAPFVRYDTWTDAEVSTPGDHMGRVRLWHAGKPISAPSEGHIVVRITPFTAA